jgi:hypothetical protein
MGEKRHQISDDISNTGGRTDAVSLLLVHTAVLRCSMYQYCLRSTQIEPTARGRSPENTTGRGAVALLRVNERDVDDERARFSGEDGA